MSLAAFRPPQQIWGYRAFHREQKHKIQPPFAKPTCSSPRLPDEVIAAGLLAAAVLDLSGRDQRGKGSLNSGLALANAQDNLRLVNSRSRFYRLIYRLKGFYRLTILASFSIRHLLVVTRLYDLGLSLAINDLGLFLPHLAGFFRVFA